MFKRYYKVVLAVFALIVVFNTSFILTTQKYKNYQTGKINPIKNYSGEIDRAAVNDLNKINTSSDNTIVSEDAEVVLILRNKNTSQSIIKSQEKVPESMIGKEKADIENLYADEGYVLESMSSNKITYVDEVQQYQYDKNKYFLGINGGYLAIYYINSDGKITAVDDKNIKKTKKVKELREDFQEQLLRGSSDLQFNSKEEAEGAYNNCVS